MIPAITVLMPVYNGAAYLAEAIDSVLAQSFADFEFLIIDDGSKDNSWEIIQTCGDARIRAVQQENRGLAATLNVGIAMARASLIARQDQDDLMRPQRLVQQFAFLSSRPSHAAVGTAAGILEGAAETHRVHRHPLTNEVLRMELLFDNPFVHSSMLLRRAALEQVGGYCEDSSRQPPEDYELWSRLARSYQVANLEEVLTGYREVAGSMSRVGERPFLANLLRISAENLHAVLSTGYSFEQCMALGALYHACPQRMPVRLGYAQAMAMLMQAASVIAGERHSWSVEMTGCITRKLRRLRREALLQHLPTAAVALMRKLRRGF